jgi:galactokinase
MQAASHAPETIQQLRSSFQLLFKRVPEQLAFVPGRVNLIGEHLDYNGGPVLPMTVSMGIYAAIAPRNDNHLRLASEGFCGVFEWDLDALPTSPQGLDWAAYPVAMAQVLRQKGIPMSGADIFFLTTLPAGAGLSSSAAIEVLTGILLTQDSIPRPQLAQWAQQAENQFVGVPCGIMDQFAVAVGQPGHALLLQSDTLAHAHVPQTLTDAIWVVMHSGATRELAHTSEYANRRAECEAALQHLQRYHSITQLAQAPADALALLSHNPTWMARAMHVVTETTRVHQTVEALQRNEPEIVGRLLIESHASLRDDYEVTGEALDSLVDAALETEGCLGARMTGAGFGGCAVALVRTAKLDVFLREVEKRYSNRLALPFRAWPVQTQFPSGYISH